MELAVEIWNPVGYPCFQIAVDAMQSVGFDFLPAVEDN